MGHGGWLEPSEQPHQARIHARGLTTARVFVRSGRYLLSSGRLSAGPGQLIPAGRGEFAHETGPVTLVYSPLQVHVERDQLQIWLDTGSRGRRIAATGRTRGDSTRVGSPAYPSLRATSQPHFPLDLSTDTQDDTLQTRSRVLDRLAQNDGPYLYYRR